MVELRISLGEPEKKPEERTKPERKESDISRMIRAIAMIAVGSMMLSILPNLIPKPQPQPTPQQPTQPTPQQPTQPLYGAEVVEIIIE